MILSGAPSWPILHWQGRLRPHFSPWREIPFPEGFVRALSNGCFGSAANSSAVAFSAPFDFASLSRRSLSVVRWSLIRSMSHRKEGHRDEHQTRLIEQRALVVCLTRLASYPALLPSSQLSLSLSCLLPSSVTTFLNPVRIPARALQLLSTRSRPTPGRAAVDLHDGDGQAQHCAVFRDPGLSGPTSSFRQTRLSSLGVTAS
jgi:hypothetical protein